MNIDAIRNRPGKTSALSECRVAPFRMRMPRSDGFSILLSLLLLLLQLVIVRGQSLSYLRKVALDRNRVVETPYTIRSIYGQFNGTSPVFVQLWRPILDSDLTIYELEWQTLARPRRGDTTGEVIELRRDQYHELYEGVDYKLGVMNDQLPGPVIEMYKYGNGVVLSLKNSKDYSPPISQGRNCSFDDLLLPYHIPVFFCNVTGCPYYLENPPTIRPEIEPDVTTEKPEESSGGNTGGTISAVRESSGMFSEEMVLGLLAWNVVLTLMVLVLLIAIIVACHDLENLKRKVKRWSHDSIENGFIIGHPTGSLGEHGFWGRTGSWTNSSLAMPTSTNDADKARLHNHRRRMRDDDQTRTYSTDVHY